ncbi:MAG: OmpA family protein [Saprospiraceae bacterium]
MGKLFFYSLFFFLLGTNCVAQNLQWANKVVDFSSQYGKAQYSAEQVLGVPNAFYSENLHYMAWVPKKENSKKGEFIQVGFAEPMQVYQVAVAESLNPGAISKIFFIDEKGKEYKIYENKRPRGKLGKKLFRKTLKYKTDYLVAEVRVELNTQAIKGSNQIDAIAISDRKTPIRVKVDVIEYQEELGKPEKLSANVNSRFAERAPMISPDGQILYFARKYHPKNIGEENRDDIWKSYRLEDGTWSKAVNIGAPLNNKHHNFVIAVNPIGNVLYVADEGVARANRKGRTWRKPKAQKIKDFYNRSEFVAYHINVNGDVMLMAVERADSYGDRDLYVSFLIGEGRWSTPLNLGKKINTVGIESSVFIAADGKTIYFSSNGHEGFGGLDMFMSRRLDDTWTNWSAPKNLGNKINSFNNDYNYSIPASGDYAYYSTDDASGMSDIFRIKLPKEVQPDPVILLSGNMIDKETKKKLNGTLKYQNLTRVDKDRTMVSSEQGTFQMVLPYGNDVGVYAEVEGYFSSSENIHLSKETVEELDSDGNGIVASVDHEKVNSNQEVERLQLRLKDLNEELEGINAERKKAKAEIKKRRKANPERYHRYQSDPELEALRHKYNQSIAGKQENKARNNSEEIASSVPNSGDPELDALRRKYQRHYKQKESPQGTTKTKDEEEKPSTSEKITGESELEAMKRKFNRHQQAKEKMEARLDKKEQKSKQEVTKVESPPQEASSPSVDFESMEIAIREELQLSLQNNVKLELQQQLFPAVKKALESSLETDLKPGAARALKNRIKNELAESETALSISNENTDDFTKELRVTLSKKVREDLRSSMKDIVREELTAEIKFLLKKQVEAEIKAELEAKIKTQIKEEVKTKPSKIPAKKEKPTPVEEKYQELKQDIILIPIKVGQVIPMNNVFFDANEAQLKNISFKELNRVLQFLEKNNKLVVEVGGHTNGWCSHEFADKLSRERSEAVAAFFVEQGIAKKRIQFRGYGKTQPVASNETLGGRKKNQRVELKILEILE